jgi:hypothetical protein
MNNECEHGVKIVKGLDIYLLCSLTKTPCSFQRYCTSRQDVINTEGAKTCMARSKKGFIVEENVVVNEEFPNEEFLSEEFKIEENPKEITEEVIVKEEKKIERKKEFGIVFLVSKSGVYYNYNNQSRYMAGKLDLKIGDKIEI